MIFTFREMIDGITLIRVKADLYAHNQCLSVFGGGKKLLLEIFYETMLKFTSEIQKVLQKVQET